MPIDYSKWANIEDSDDEGPSNATAPEVDAKETKSASQVEFEQQLNEAMAKSQAAENQKTAKLEKKKKPGPPSTGRSKGPIDYTKWDNIDSESEDEGQKRKAIVRELHAAAPSHITKPKMVTHSLPTSAVEDNILTLARSTCLEAADKSPFGIDEDNIARFLKSIKWDAFQQAQTAERIQMDITFASQDAKVNFWCLTQLLNFGSSYHKQLREYYSRDSWEHTITGVCSMVRSAPRLDALFMRKVDLVDVGEWYGIPLVIEENNDHTDGPLRAFAELVVEVMHSTGAILEAGGFVDFAAFVQVHSKDATGQPSASHLVYHLSSKMPAFCDSHVVKGEQVVLLRKAQTLAWQLHMRFGLQGQEALRFGDIDLVCPCDDFLVSASLVALEVLQLPDGELDHLDIANTCYLRAATHAAIHRIVAAAEGQFDQFTASRCEKFLVSGPMITDVKVFMAKRYLLKAISEPNSVFY